MKLALSLLTAATFLVGCTGSPSTTASPASPASKATVSVATTPSPSALASPSAETLAAVEALKAKFQNGKFEYQAVSDAANGPAFLEIAQTEGPMTTGALEGLAATYTHYAPDTKKHHPDARYEAVVLRELDTKDPLRLYFALKAAQALMGEKPYPKTVDKVIEIVKSDREVGARYEAMETLFVMKNFLADQRVVDAFVSCLKGDPALQSNALFRFRTSAYDLPDKSVVYQATQSLATSADAGVRGRALQVLTETVPDQQKPALTQTLTNALKDPSPFVRSAAAESLAKLQKENAVRSLIPLLDDKASNTHEIEFQGLRGHKETVHHDGSPWSRVDDAALYALETSTAMMPADKKFDYGKIDYKTVDQDIAKEVQAAKSWFKNSATSLP